jgi:hypothetical protein
MQIQFVLCAGDKSGTTAFSCAGSPSTKMNRPSGVERKRLAALQLPTALGEFEIKLNIDASSFGDPRRRRPSR